MSRRFSGWTAIHVLLLVATLEVAINRIAVPMSRPPPGVVPPLWHTLLDFFGLFCQYFTGVLAGFVVIRRGVTAVRAGRAAPTRIAGGVRAAFGAVAIWPLLAAAPQFDVVIELGFALVLVATAIRLLGRDRDLGVQIGMGFLLVPLVLQVVTFCVRELHYPDGVFFTPGAPGPTFAKAGLIALSIAALATPYCFAPRPFARAVAKPIPIIVAMALAAVGAVVARGWYGSLVEAAKLGAGARLETGGPDPQLALYLLAIATLAWTLTACLTAATEARRTIGAGVALLVLGGYQFAWPHHFLLAALGLAVIADAATRVRTQEREAMPYVAEAPPIADATWSTYLGTLATGLRRVLEDVHSVTTRGDGGLASSVIVGSARGIDVRTRIERIDGSVVALDVVVGREVEERRGSTLTVWAAPARGLGTNPPGPPSDPALEVGDLAFDRKFRVRGDAAAFHALFDDGSRARAVAALDGWLAYWQDRGLRYRVYPGRGAPLDHPLPVSDLALGRVPGNAERLVAVIELLIELGGRVIAPAPLEEQSA